MFELTGETARVDSVVKWKWSEKLEECSSYPLVLMEAFTSVCQLLVYVLDTDRHVLNCTLILAFPSEIAASYL